MADVRLREDTLQIELSVPERVQSLHTGPVVVPLSRVREVHVVTDVLTHLRGARTPGTAVEGVCALGTWAGKDGDRLFHDLVVVERAGPGVVVTLDGSAYDRILLDADEPEELADQLRA